MAVLVEFTSLHCCFKTKRETRKKIQAETFCLRPFIFLLLSRKPFESDCRHRVGEHDIGGAHEPRRSGHHKELSGGIPTCL